jgi:hypothetical protein
MTEVGTTSTATAATATATEAAATAPSLYGAAQANEAATAPSLYGAAQATATTNEAAAAAPSLCGEAKAEATATANEASAPTTVIARNEAIQAHTRPRHPGVRVLDCRVAALLAMTRGEKAAAARMAAVASPSVYGTFYPSIE